MKRQKITLILRDAWGNPHSVKIYAGARILIEVLGGNMVMHKPRQYDTNKLDGSKKYRPDGIMEFIATPKCVKEFNTIINSYDAENYIWRKEEAFNEGN